MGEKVDLIGPLRKEPHPIRNTLLVIGGAALVIAGTWGGVALAQSGQSTEPLVVGDASSEEPTPTPEPNVAPVAAIDTPAVTDLTVTVAGTASDEDGEIASQGWNFGDGSFAEGASATHTYAAAGTYTISYAVTDDRGATASATVQVTVAAPPPPPAPPAPSEPEAPVYGQYPSGYPMPRIPGTDAPDTSACASSAGYTDSAGIQRCV